MFRGEDEGKASRSAGLSGAALHEEKKRARKKRHSFTVRCCDARIHATLSRVLTAEPPRSVASPTEISFARFLIRRLASMRRWTFRGSTFPRGI